VIVVKFNQVILNELRMVLKLEVQGGSNMTGTICV